MTQFFCRSLYPYDAELFREARLEALAWYGDLFDKLYAFESQKPLEWWRDQCTEKTDRCWFGSFTEEGKLIGIQGTRIWEKSPNVPVAIWWGNYAKEEWQGKGAMRDLYQARINWAVETGCDHIMVYTLKGQDRPAEILRKIGAQYLYDETMPHAGGMEAVWHWWQIPIASSTLSNGLVVATAAKERFRILTNRRRITKHNNIAIRPLTQNDGHAYRALRQKIIESGEGKLFGYSFIRERQFTGDEWRDWLTETPKHCIFGAFVNGELIGVMGIVACKTVPHVVEWDDTWIDPRYRKSGIAKLAYEKVYQWTTDHEYDFAIVIIREDNHRCIEIRQRQGFSYIDTKPNDIWADGSRAASKSFMLNLNENITQKRTLNRLEKALEFFYTPPMHDNPGLITRGVHVPTH